jgi:hypothetical protein
MLSQQLEPPVLHLAPRGFNQPSVDAAILIVHDVDRLDEFEQRLLMDFTERAPSSPWIVSTARGPLLNMLASGGFLLPLYYRLNMVYIDVGRFAIPRIEPTA